jgi:multidrug efflux system outer membrane protein
MRRRAFGAAALLLHGCTLGPGYHRPAIDVPGSYRAGENPAAPGEAAPSLGEQSWSAVFQDPVLQELIRTALAHSYDLGIAATHVLEAQAQLGITRADSFPTLALGAGALSERVPGIVPGVPGYQARAGELDVSVVWNLDFWGKYRAQTRAARAELLATEWGRRAVLSSVVAGVATAYFQLRELDLALEISARTLKSREDSLRLTRVLAEHGSASTLDVRQAEQLVYTAGATIADLERQRGQQENALSVLLGRNPGDIPRGRSLVEQPELPGVPAGLPSELLERRPDIRQAEASLVAASARIQAARAAFFPSISLTGTGGQESPALNHLFAQSAQMWTAVASLSQPIFEGGALRANLRLAKAQREEQILTYSQTILNAFRQVSDALIALQKSTEARKQLLLLTEASRDADRLSHVLFEHGGASYLQVITAETAYFSAQLGLAAAELSERLALVQLYNALGGGWNQEVQK